MSKIDDDLNALMLRFVLPEELSQLVVPAIEVKESPVIHLLQQSRSRSKQRNSGQAYLNYAPAGGRLTELSDLITKFSLDSINQDQLESQSEQVEIIDEYLENPDAFYCWGSTGSGKTPIGIVACVKAHLQGQISLFITNRLNLVSQTADRIHTFTDVPKEAVVCLTDLEPAKRTGLYERVQAPIVISTAQRVLNDIREGRLDPKKVGVIVFDEAHHLTEGYEKKKDTLESEKKNEGQGLKREEKKEQQAYKELLGIFKTQSETSLLFLSATPAGSQNAFERFVKDLGRSLTFRALGQDDNFRPRLIPQKVNWDSNFEGGRSILVNLVDSLSRDLGFQKVPSHSAIEALLMRVDANFEAEQISSDTRWQYINSGNMLKHLLHVVSSLEIYGRNLFLFDVAKKQLDTIKRKPRWFFNLENETRYVEAIRTIAEGTSFERLFTSDLSEELIRKWKRELINNGSYDAKLRMLHEIVMGLKSRNPQEKIILAINRIDYAEFIFDLMTARQDDWPVTPVWFCGDHGKKERSRAMRAFESGDADLLIATSALYFGADLSRVMQGIVYAPPQYGIDFQQLLGRFGRTRDSQTGEVQNAEVRFLLASGSSDERFYGGGLRQMEITRDYFMKLAWKR